MAILQALLALISKSAGKILNAIFGWAVRALFGRTTAKEQMFLSALVGAAVAWPVLLVGAVFPRTGALLLAFVPIPHWVPAWIVRIVWLSLAALVPFSLGLAIAAKAPPAAPPESFVKRLLRGFPITIGLAAAFIIMFVSVPIMRFWAMVKKQVSADVPIVTDTAAYHEVAALALSVLNRHGFDLKEAEPGWWVRAPTRILSWFGGNAFRAFVPQKLEHFESPALSVSFYPSGVVLRGEPQKTMWAHGLIAEAVTHSRGLQTFDPEAQDLERQIRRIWKVLDEEPAAHVHSARLLGRTRELAQDLGKVNVSFDDWQVVYRQVLQLERAIQGQTQLLDAQPRQETGDRTMSKQSEESTKVTRDEQTTPPATRAGREEGTAQPQRPLENLSTAELVKELTSQVGLLAKKQIDLAATELRADLTAELAMVGGLGIAAIASILGLAVLLVAGVFGLALLMPGWEAALIVGGGMLLIAGIAAAIGWGKRVRSPLRRTRQTLKEDVQWGKEKLA
jgi:Putative Actinobacterial Holin-X, holin superfamily III